MQEIILYAVLTLIVGAMLYSVLGKSAGQGSEKAIDPKDILNKISGNDKPAPPEFEYEGPAKEGLQKIAKADANFSVPNFIDGAKAAYGMILEAFAEGDRETLEYLLNDEVKQTYFDTIDAREAKDQTLTIDLARLASAQIVEADLVGKTGTIYVAYTAELSKELVDKNGDTIEGDADMLSQTQEVWGFERTLGSKNPNWILSDVQPHAIDGGEKGKDSGPDHSPDHSS